MRLTLQNARMDKGGRHNDRNFDTAKTPHINKERTSDNMYWTYNGDTVHTFREIEMEFYENHFRSHLDEQNKRNAKAGHKSRNRTMNKYWKGENTQPEDQILQIGDINRHASAEDLWECTMEYINRFNDMYGDFCKIIDVAMHVDEATPHVHVRRVWVGQDKDGHDYVSQSKALERYGAENGTADRNKFNNVKTFFTRQDRELFYNVCREKELDVEISNATKRPHLDTALYKTLMKEIEHNEHLRTEELDEREAKINSEAKKMSDKLIECLSDSGYLYDKHLEEIEAANKKKRESERLSILAKIYAEEIQSITGSHRTQKEVVAAVLRDFTRNRLGMAEDFIKEKGYDEEYRSYINRRAINIDDIKR